MFPLTRIIIVISLSLFTSCSKEKKTHIANDGFFIELNVENRNGFYSYLHELNSKYQTLDSVKIKNNIAVFEGILDFPKRYFIRIENIASAKMIVLENDSISIVINTSTISESLVKGSKLQNELMSFQNKSQNILSKTELLFPDLQRARLENNPDELKIVFDQIEAIEQENILFCFDYIQHNSDSFISAMILNDLTNREPIDIDKVTRLYNNLTSKVKKGSDAQAIRLFLDSQH